MAMYARGMSQRDIEDTLREIYGSEISQGMISRITDRILPGVNEWQNRPLSPPVQFSPPVMDWGLAYAQFSIYFEDRFVA